MRTNPFAAADLRSSFADPAGRRALAILPGGLALVLYAWWPRGDLAWHLRNTAPPQTLVAVAVALLLIAAWLNGRTGSVGERPGETSLLDLVARTPVTVRAVLAGRLAGGATVVLLQLILALPFLVAGLGVSGVGASALPGVLVVVGAAALAWRTVGLALRLALPAHGALRDVLLFAASAGYLAGTFVALPVANPLAVLVDLAGGSGSRVTALGAALPSWAVSGMIALAATAAATLAAATALRAARKAGGGTDAERGRRD